MPYKISTLLYCFNETGEALLLHRKREPNLGLWSPCGGKLQTDTGESPHTCACREAQEELALKFATSDFHLTGIISEHGYQGQSHWLMFLFELQVKLRTIPAPIPEGDFQFFAPSEINKLPIPETDRERIWPWFWEHRGSFFAAHCHCHDDGRYDWLLEQSNKPQVPTLALKS